MYKIISLQIIKISQASANLEYYLHKRIYVFKNNNINENIKITLQYSER